MSNEPTVNIDKFLGIYNREQSRRLPVGALTTAENVDVDDTGGIIRRQGYVKSLDLTSVTSAFSTQDERRLFVVADGELLHVDRDLHTTVIAAGVSSDYIQWVEVADFILLSNGFIIDADNRVSTWRIESPPAPVARVQSGSLRAGQYQFAVTYVDALGREGPASPVVVMDLMDESGVSLTFSQVLYPSARIYASDTNGTELYYLGQCVSGQFTVTDVSNASSPIDDCQLGAIACPSKANILAHYNARIWAAETEGPQSTVWYSEPYWWNIFKDFIVVPGQIRVMVGHRDGLIIGTDDEIYVYNDSLVRVAEYGVPSGVPYTIDDSGTVFLWTKQGLCSALPFQNMTEVKVSLPTGKVCFSALVEQNGFKKVVVLTDGEGDADNSLI